MKQKRRRHRQYCFSNVSQTDVSHGTRTYTVIEFSNRQTREFFLFSQIYSNVN